MLLLINFQGTIFIKNFQHPLSPFQPILSNTQTINHYLLILYKFTFTKNIVYEKVRDCCFYISFIFRFLS